MRWFSFLIKLLPEMIFSLPVISVLNELRFSNMVKHWFSDPREILNKPALTVLIDTKTLIRQG